MNVMEKEKYTRYIPSDSEKDDNEEESATEPDNTINANKGPKDVKSMKIAANNLFVQRHQSPW